jgi:hypothetical protein
VSASIAGHGFTVNAPRFQIVRVSRNGKVGPIPTVATSSNTCPPSCAMQYAQDGKKEGACYGKHGPIAIHWKKLNAGLAGVDFSGLLDFIESLPTRQLWRYNTVGDLVPSAKNREQLEPTVLRAICDSNSRRNLRGFGFTHYDLFDVKNRLPILGAYVSGLVINASCNTMGDAIALKTKHPELSAVAIAPETYSTKVQTIAGVRFVQCPATWSDSVQCLDCGLCAKPNRAEVIVFPAHGSGRKTANLIATDKAA